MPQPDNATTFPIDGTAASNDARSTDTGDSSHENAVFPWRDAPDAMYSVLSSLFGQASLGVACLDRDLRYVWVNDRLAAINGKSASEHIGRTPREILGEQVWTDRQRFFERALAGETVENVVQHAVLIPPARESRDVILSFYPVRRGNLVDGVTVVVSDFGIPNVAERLLRQQSLAFENMYDALIISDLEGHIVDVNAAFERDSGYRRSEVLGQLVSIMHAPEVRETLLPQIRDGLIRAGRWAGEVPFQRKDGSRGYADATVVPILDECGVIVGVVSANRDITERKRNEGMLAAQKALLEQQRHWLQNLLDLLPTPLIMIEPGTGRITFANRAADQLAGGEFPRGDIDSAAHPVTRGDDSRKIIIADTDRPRMRVARGEEVHGFQMDWRLPGGTRSLIVEGMTLPEVHGHPAVGVITLQDVTRLKQTERANARLLKEAKENSRKQRVFLREVMASVTEGKLRICDTTADLPVPLAPFGDMILLDSTRQLCRSRHLAEDAASRLGLSDARQQNLITAVSEGAMNAIVHAGGGTVRVATNGNDLVQVWIEDQGRGITMEHLPRATLERGYTTAGSLGHGFWLMLRTIDRLYLLTGVTGTTVVLEQQRDPPAPPWLSEGF